MTAKQQKKRRSKKVALGICVSCKEPAVAGNTLCEKHKLIAYRRSAAWRRKKRRQGLCWCGRSIDSGSNCRACKINNRIACLDVLPREKLKAKQAIQKFNKRCQCCGSRNHGHTNWHLDHNHKTKIFRGIICHPCNSTIGMSKESSSRLLACVKYMNRRSM